MKTVRDATYDLLRKFGLTTIFGNVGSTEVPRHRGNWRQVVAGVLRGWSCSTVPGGAKSNGRHAEVVNKIKGPSFKASTTNQKVRNMNSRRQFSCQRPIFLNG
jgi:hypothetical protein